MAEDTATPAGLNMEPVTVTVCTTCRRADVDPEAPRPGSIMLAALQESALPANVTLRGVECLSACDHGCTMALTGGDNRWSYVYGNLNPDEHVAEVAQGIAAYAETDDGLVPWRSRPVVFRKQSIARIPPVELPSEDTK